MALERRIRAAQVLGGFKSLDDLAAEIGRENAGLSRKTLRRIASENDPRQAKDYELAWIAEACDVPLSFFSGDIAPEPDRTQLDRIEQQLLANSQALEVLLGGLANGGVAEEPQLEAALNHLVELRRHSEAQQRTA